VLAVLVDHRPDTSVGGAGDHGVSHTQGSRLNQHRGHRTATLVELGFNGHTARLTGGVCPQIKPRVCSQQHSVQQFVDALALERGHPLEHGRPRRTLQHQAVFGELLQHLVGVCALHVDLVHRHHNGHTRGLGVVERLNGLGHDAVVSGDHQDGDVGDVRTTGSHRGKRLVTGGVDEGDCPFDCRRARSTPGRHQCAG
jgi:hypothetical protein